MYFPADLLILQHTIVARRLGVHGRALAISADPRLQFEPDAAKCLLGKIFDRVWELGDERAFWTLAPKNETLAMYTTQRSLSLVVLRRFAYWLGISLPSLLAGEVDCWTGQLDPNWLHHLPKSIRPERRRMRVDRDHVLEQLTALRKSVDDNNPPPLAQVARIVGVSTGGLEYLFPEICKDIKRRYQQWKEQERNRLPDYASDSATFRRPFVFNKLRDRRETELGCRDSLKSLILLVAGPSARQMVESYA